MVTCMVFLSNLKLSLHTHEGIQGRCCTTPLVLNIGATRGRVVKVTPRPLYLRERTPVTIKHEDAMGGACGAYGGGERYAQGSGGETGGKETIGETQT